MTLMYFHLKCLLIRICMACTCRRSEGAVRARKWKSGTLLSASLVELWEVSEWVSEWVSDLGEWVRECELEFSAGEQEMDFGHLRPLWRICYKKYGTNNQKCTKTTWMKSAQRPGSEAGVPRTQLWFGWRASNQQPHEVYVLRSGGWRPHIQPVRSYRQCLEGSALPAIPKPSHGQFDKRRWSKEQNKFANTYRRIIVVPRKITTRM